jgi:hypothetical protein
VSSAARSVAVLVSRRIGRDEWFVTLVFGLGLALVLLAFLLGAGMLL